MKKILMIGTGGTIASEMTPEGLAPELNTQQLLEFIPDIGALCHVDCLQVYNLDSTNIRPGNTGWGWWTPCGKTTTPTTASSSATARTPWPTPRRR